MQEYIDLSGSEENEDTQAEDGFEQFSPLSDTYKKRPRLSLKTRQQPPKQVNKRKTKKKKNLKQNARLRKQAASQKSTIELCSRGGG